MREGETVSLSLPLNTRGGVANPNPADHHMTNLGGGPGDIDFAMDYVGVDYHHDGHTHIDALCHVGYKGLLYNDRPEDEVGEAGAAANSIEVLENGLVGRGVLSTSPACAAPTGSSRESTSSVSIWRRPNEPRG